MNILFKYIANTIWWFVVLSVVMLATSLVLFLQVSPYISEYRSQIEKNLTQILGYPISIGYIEASLVGLDLIILVEDISLIVPVADNSNAEPIKLESLIVQLDLLQSIVNLEPNFSLIRFYKPEIQLAEEQGQWFIPGMSRGESNETGGLSRLLNYLLNQDHMSVLDLKVELASESHGDAQLSSEAIYVQRSSKGLGISGSLQHSHYSQIFKFDGEWVGNLAKPESLKFEAAFTIPELNLDIDKWLNSKEFKLGDVNFGADIWLKYNPDNSVALSGRFISNIDQYLGMEHQLQSEFKINYGIINKALQVDLVNLLIVQDNELYPASNVSFFSDLSNDDLAFELGFDQFDLSLAHGLLTPHLDSQWFISKMLDDMQPIGVAQNAKLTVRQEGDLKFQYKSNLSISKASGYNNIPSMTQMEAILEVTETKGKINFASNDATIGFPLLFDELWETQGISGEVAWESLQDAFVVNGQDLFVRRHGADINGTFYLEIPEDEAGTLLLDLQANNVPLTDKLDYIPNKGLPSDAIEWIDERLLSGQVKRADFSLQTSFAEGEVPRVLLELDVESTKIKFADDWPAAEEVDGSFVLDSNGIDVVVRQAHLDAVAVQDIFISLPFQQGTLDQVRIQGQIAENVDRTLALLRSTLLAETVLQPFESWQSSGHFLGKFELAIPLANEVEQPYLSLLLDFNDNDLRIDNLNLPMHIHSGHLEYDTKTGINNSSFQISTLGGDANVRLFSNQPINKPIQVIADIQGDADAYEIVEWLQFPTAMTQAFSGKVNFSGDLNINKQKPGQVDLKLVSSLQGTQLDFPKPFFKESDVAQDLTINLTAYEDTLLVDTTYQEHNARISFSKGAFYGGEIFVNESSNFSEKLESGLSIKGELLSYDDAAWQAFLSQGKQDEEQVQKFDLKIPDWLNKVNLIADHVDVNEDNRLNNVKMSYDKTLLDEGFRLNSDEMNVKLTQDDHGAVVHFGYLSWATSEEEKKEKEEPPFKVSQIPNLTFSVDELYLNSKPYGDWHMVITSEGNRLRIDPLSSNLKNGSFSGSLFWQDDIDRSNVQLILDLAGDDIQEASQEFSKDAFMSSKKYEVKVVLNWLGNPFGIDRESLSGKISFLAENGRINAIETMPTFLKALGIFNLNALSRRLTLDFSDVNLPGLTYDTLSGNMSIENGILNTTEPLKIVSPTVELILEGQANLVTETLNETLTASFPLGGTLPVASLLLGVTPQIAGLLYITDKILGDPLSKVTSIQYRIKGPFKSPKIVPIAAKDEGG